jgi:peroxiredoxin
MPEPISKRVANPFATLLSIFTVVACGQPRPPSQHAILDLAPEPQRGWRVEADHVGEWMPVPAPGMITVIDFWSTTCTPCIEAMPALEQLWRETDRTRVQVLGVAMDEEPVQIQRALPALGVTFPMLIDSAGALSGAYKVGGVVPATFVLDRRGRVRFYANGEEGLSRVAEVVLALLDE